MLLDIPIERLVWRHVKLRPIAIRFQVKLSVFVAGLLISQTLSGVVDADCQCGPDYCLNDARYAQKLASKKQALAKKGFSGDLIALLDQDGHCVAAIEQGPDTFFIKRRLAGGWDTKELTDEREAAAKDYLMSGAADAYYKFNTNRALACCGEPAYNKRSDWNENLDMNMKLVLACKKTGESVACTPGH